MIFRQPLLKSGLSLWAVASSIRASYGIVLATHMDRWVHPIFLELSWHSVWLIPANSITYYVFIILEISRNGMKKYRSGRRSGEKITAVVVNSTWVIGFFIVSVLDGLSKNWPRPATQWYSNYILIPPLTTIEYIYNLRYMWTTYSMYGLVMVTTAARSFLQV